MKLKILLFIQSVLIVLSLIYSFLYNCNLAGFVSITGMKLLIIISLIYIYISLYVLKIGFLHVYSIFIATVSLYNISYVLVSFWVGDSILYSTKSFMPINFTVYSAKIVFNYLSIILFFYLFIHLGALFYISTLKAESYRDYEWKYDAQMELYGKILFYAFLLPSLYYYYHTLGQIFLAGGYMNAFGLEGSRNMNIIIRISDDIMKLGSLMLLASKAKKSKIIVPVVVYLLINFCISVISGSRVYFISQALFILVYFSMRVKIRPVIILLCVSFFVVFSIFVRDLRSSSDYTVNSNVSEMFSFDEFVDSFVYPQGGSMHIVGLTVSLLEENKLNYSMRFFLDPLMGKRGYEINKRTDEYYNLADRLSAIMIPKYFIAGGGLGSSIIAEFYIYGGFITLITFSFLYGFLIFLLDDYKYKTNRMLTIYLFLLPGLFYVGRAHPWYPLQNLLILVVLYLLLLKSGLMKTVVGLLRRR